MKKSKTNRNTPKCPKPKIELKRYVIKKYVMAKSAHDALSKERRVRPDDVFIDEEWLKANPNQLVSAIGFSVDVPNYYDE